VLGLVSGVLKKTALLGFYTKTNATVYEREMLARIPYAGNPSCVCVHSVPISVSSTGGGGCPVSIADTVNRGHVKEFSLEVKPLHTDISSTCHNSESVHIRK
jgi:hypothetical protein